MHHIKMETSKQIDDVMGMAIENQEVAGVSLLLMRDGEEVYYHNDGYADIGAGEKLKRDTIFRLYSMSKPVTAAATMILMERGLVDLMDPVSKFLPGFKGQQVAVEGGLAPVVHDVTLKELLNMTSGLLYGGDNVTGKKTESLINTLEERLLSVEPMTTIEVMNKLGEIPLAFQPGSSWFYGTSADVLGAVVEVVSGKSFGTFLSDEIFAPLNMGDTGFYVPADERHRLAKVYGETESGLEVYTDNRLGIINAMDREPAFESGGAGLVSTIDDYAKFATMLQNGGVYEETRILKENTVKFLTTQVLNEPQMKSYRDWHTLAGYSYGNLMRVGTNPELAGMFIGEGEYGWDGWLGCYFANLPKEGLTILMMMQKTDAGTTSLARKLRNILLAELL